VANDPPTNLRMGFGYKQARAAGLTGIRTSRAPRTVNRLIEENRQNRSVVEFLQDAVAKDPGWGPYVKHRIREGGTAFEIAGEVERMRVYVLFKYLGYSRGRLKKYIP
jgi:hypothetical protein